MKYVSKCSMWCFKIHLCILFTLIFRLTWALLFLFSWCWCSLKLRHLLDGLLIEVNLLIFSLLNLTGGFKLLLSRCFKFLKIRFLQESIGLGQTLIFANSLCLFPEIIELIFLFLRTTLDLTFLLLNLLSLCLVFGLFSHLSFVLYCFLGGKLLLFLIFNSLLFIS